jgi:hypothetical protein
VCFCVLYIKPEGEAFRAKNCKISPLTTSKLQTIFPTVLASLIFLAFIRSGFLILNDLAKKLVGFPALLLLLLFRAQNAKSPARASGGAFLKILA